MHAAIAAAGFALGASAAVLPRDQCCFSLTASGGASGALSQLDDGQNRIGGSGSEASYCINNGAITDSNGRGCILTPPTTQFQCDSGATPTSGFSVASNGQLQYSNIDTFYACPVNDYGEWNVYSQPVEGQLKCVQISLSTGGQCSSSGSGTGSGTGSGGSGSAVTSAPAASQTYACNPAHSYPDGASCISTAGSLTLVHASASATPSSGSNCKAQYDACAFATDANQAQCAADYSNCLGYNPFAGNDASSTAPPAATASSGSDCKAQYDACAYAPDANQATCASNYASCLGYNPFASNDVSSATVTAPPSQKTTYACNPAHSYPDGVSCISTAGSLTLVSPSNYVGTAESRTASPSNYVGTAESRTASASNYVGTAESRTASASNYVGTAESRTASTHAATATKPAGSGSSSGSACQTSLSGAYQTPHLIVPISSSFPDESCGTSYTGQINSTTSTIFNFDIPSSYSGKQCSVVFLFPQKSDLETSSYDFSGSGSLSFSQLSGACSQDTTWNTAPSVSSQMNSIAIQSGNSYVVSTGSCNAGQSQTVMLGSQGGLSLNFFEDW